MSEFDWLEFGTDPLFFAFLALLSLAERLGASADLKADRKRRWPTNFVFYVLGLVVAALAPVSVLAVAAWGESHSIGLMNHFVMPEALRFAISILAISFAGYVMHYASHAIPLLWRFHIVHHADHFVDASTSLRSHPLEPLIVATFLILVVAVLGLSSTSVLIYSIVEITVAIFNHSRFRLPAAVDRLLSWLFVTPSFHHIHHSSYQPETDSNYGNVLTIWDYLFGTFSKQHMKTDAPIQYGLKQVPPEKASDLDAMLVYPFRK